MLASMFDETRKQRSSNTLSLNMVGHSNFIESSGLVTTVSKANKSNYNVVNFCDKKPPFVYCFKKHSPGNESKINSMPVCYFLNGKDVPFFSW